MSIGTWQRLSARLGNSLPPKLCVVRLRQVAQVYDARGAVLVTALFLQESATTPVEGLNFTWSRLPAAAPTAEVRFRVSLSKEAVQALYAKASTAAAAPSTAGARPQPGQRVVYYTWSLEAASGDRRPLFYGPLVIQAGASGGVSGG